jgi:competence protein ComGC
MAKREGKGSILLKILIAILVIITILVIKIPNNIWHEEERIKQQCRDNMSSVHEAYRYYQQVHGEYIQDMQQMIASIQNDSTLLKRHKIVTYTKRLVDATESFMRIPAIYDLHQIQTNIVNILDDIEANSRYFKGYTEIFDESQNILRSLSALNLGNEYENYRNVSSALDTLWQVRRDLSENPLQIAAMRISLLAEKVAKNLSDVNFNALENHWNPLNETINSFIKKINSDEKLRLQTNIVYRVANFQDIINDVFKNRNEYNLNTSQQLAETAKENLNQVYQEFLADFLITENIAQFRLSDEDSMLINLSESNFYTPFENQPYIIALNDTGGVSVEDPTLLSELQQNLAAPLVKIQNLPFLAPIKSYLAALDSIDSYTKMLKSIYRRNKEVSQQIVEIGITINFEIEDLGEIKNFKDLLFAAGKLQGNNSYYEITKYLEETRTAIHQIDQRYQQNLFRLDTLHARLIPHITELESILKKIRKNTYTLDPLLSQLENSYNQYKAVSATEVNSQTNSIVQEIEDILKFAAEGSEVPVYMLFSQKIQNHGRVYGRTGEKSWEEEE